MDEDETGEGAEEPEAGLPELASDEEPDSEPSNETVAPEPPAAVAAAPEKALHVSVQIGDNGEGSAFVGLDVDQCSLWGVPADYSVGIVAAHTVGISKVLVSGAEPGSTVNVTVLPKR